MIDNFQLALTLMLIGMVSVFAILALVVQSGRLIIFLVNKFSPNEGGQGVTHEKSGKHIAVIAAVVDSITQGKGSIQEISKKV